MARLTRWTSPDSSRQSGRSSGVEHNLAKVGVEGSNPFARSKNFKKISRLGDGRQRRAGLEMHWCPPGVHRFAFVNARSADDQRTSNQHFHCALSMPFDRFGLAGAPLAATYHAQPPTTDRHSKAPPAAAKLPQTLLSLSPYLARHRRPHGLSNGLSGRSPSAFPQQRRATFFRRRTSRLCIAK